MDLNQSLMCFGLTRQEASIYIQLLTDGVLTGYEAAKATGISRSNAYMSLAGLVDKGAAELIEGSPTKYLPVPVGEFCDKKLKNLSSLKEGLIRVLPDQVQVQEAYVTVRGREHIISKVETMLEKAVYRVYISGTVSIIKLFEASLERLLKKAVKVVILTEAPYSLEGAIVYHCGREPEQIGVIADSEVVLTGEFGIGNTCLYSRKKNLVDLFKKSLSNEIRLIEMCKGVQKS